MKMNKIDASKFPSWLFSRFKKQENLIPENETAEENNASAKSDAAAYNPTAEGKDVIADKVANKEACSENAESTALVEALNEKNTETENTMMEFGIMYGKKSGAVSEFSFGIETVDEVKEKTPDNMERSNADGNNETNEVPAIADDIVNSGAGINAVDPFKILDQLSSIKENRTKKRR